MSQLTAGALKGLATALRQQQKQLTEHWMQLAFGDADVEHSDDLTYRQLADHIPRIFDEICLVLESQDMDSQEHAIEQEARQHGKWRWQQGYRVDELVRELDLLRQILLAAIGDYAQNHPAFDRKREERARLITDQVLSFVTLTSIREAVGERDRKLDEYTGMLERANQELTLRQRLISDLYETRMQVARRVAHDLRNFLNVFATALQLIGRSQAKNDRALALAKRQVADMATLVDEMGEYSKVLGDDSILTVERFDLAELFDELMQRVPPRFGVTFSAVDQSTQNGALTAAPLVSGLLAVSIGIRMALVAAACVSMLAFLLFAIDHRASRSGRV